MVSKFVSTTVVRVASKQAKFDECKWVNPVVRVASKQAKRTTSCSGWRLLITCRDSVDRPLLLTAHRVPKSREQFLFLYAAPPTEDVVCYLLWECHPWLISIMTTNVAAKRHVKCFDHEGAMCQIPNHAWERLRRTQCQPQLPWTTLTSIYDEQLIWLHLHIHRGRFLL
jgi:hypothetical protein